MDNQLQSINEEEMDNVEEIQAAKRTKYSLFVDPAQVGMENEVMLDGAMDIAGKDYNKGAIEISELVESPKHSPSVTKKDPLLCQVENNQDKAVLSEVINYAAEKEEKRLAMESADFDDDNVVYTPSKNSEDRKFLLAECSITAEKHFLNQDEKKKLAFLFEDSEDDNIENTQDTEYSQDNSKAQDMYRSSQGSESFSTPTSDKSSMITDVKSQIKQDLTLKTGKYKVFPKDCGNRKASGVWENFLCVEDEAGKVMDYVVCKICMEVYAYVSTNGTTTLGNHLRRCLAANPSRRIEMEASPSVHSCTMVERTEATMEAVKMCAIDFRPFETVAGKGFKHLVQSCMDVATKYSERVLVDDLLPDPTTVSRNTSIVEHRTMAKMTAMFHQHCFVQGIGIAFTTDMYTEDYTKISYSALTAHFIDQGWKLRGSTLGCREFPPEEKHTSVNIMREISILMQQYNLANLPKDETCFVTDKGSANTGAEGFGTRFTHSICSNHNLSTVINWIFKKTATQTNGVKGKPHYRYQANIPEILKTIDNCRALVQHANQSDIQSKLDHTLKSENDTRWNSMFEMLNSILDAYDRLTVLLSLERKEDKITCINKVILKQLVSFLFEFKTATKRLEAVKSPTIQLVILTYQTLLAHCEKHIDTEFTEMKCLKKIVLTTMKKKFTIDKVHVAGAFLDPRQVSRMSKYDINESVYNEAIKWIACMCENHKLRDDALESKHVRNNSDEQCDSLFHSKNQHNKHFVPTTSLFSFGLDDKDSVLEDNKTQVDLEIEQYKSTRLLRQQLKDDSFDILKWWAKNEAAIPHLAKVARFVLAIPASSSDSERVFSASSNTVTVKRTGLLPSNINGLIIIKSNADLLEESHGAT
jgi:zinc finger BED domain-containing protein 1 (E3 SUMO-protein ligase ZBED1)